MAPKGAVYTKDSATEGMLSLGAWNLGMSLYTAHLKAFTPRFQATMLLYFPRRRMHSIVESFVSTACLGDIFYAVLELIK